MSLNKTNGTQDQRGSVSNNPFHLPIYSESRNGILLERISFVLEIRYMSASAELVKLNVGNLKDMRDEF